jgi:hypothetical protein
LETSKVIIPGGMQSLASCKLRLPVVKFRLQYRTKQPLLYRLEVGGTFEVVLACCVIHNRVCGFYRLRVLYGTSLYCKGGYLSKWERVSWKQAR